MTGSPARWACAWAAVLGLGCGGSKPAVSTPMPRVAVLPFESLSGNAESARIVTRLLQNALSARADIQLLDPGKVEDALASLRIRQPALMTESERQALSERLDFDLALVGSVLSYGTAQHPYAGVVALVSLTARVVRSEDGATVWADTRSKQGSDSQWLFGLGSKHDPALLADEMCRAIVKDIVWLDL